MNEYQDWRTKEFSLVGFLFYCLEKWRWIIGCMLVVAVIGGVYKYQSAVNMNQSGKSEKVSTENIEGDTNQKSIEFYEHAIEEIEYESKIQEDYLKQSVVMQMDPYHVSTGTLSYYLEGGEYTSSIIAAYSAFISSGRMAEELYSVNSYVPIEDLQYLISFINSITNSVYKIGDDQIIKTTEEGGVVFQIQIRIPDSDLGETYLNCAKEIMSEYSSQMQTELAEHKLTLLDSAQSEMIDSDIQEYQSAIRSAYMTSVRNLQTLRTEYETIRGTEDENITSVIVINPVSSAVKFAVLGLVMGAFLSCLVLLALYILGGRLQDTESFNEEFGMPLLGIVRASGEKRKLFGFIDAWVFRLSGGVYAKTSLEEQIKIAAANIQTAILGNSSDRKIKKIMLAGTISEKDAEELCIRFVSEIPEVSFSSYKQIIFQSLALKELKDYDGILFLEKKGSSNAGFIRQEKKLALDRDVKILGTVVVC